MQADPRQDRINWKPDMTEQFLRVLMGVTDEPCTEVRLFRAKWEHGRIVPNDAYPVTFGGWYDTPETISRETAAIRGVSAYVTLNPARKELLARSYEKLIRLKKEDGTKDSEIASLSWLYIDVDAKRAPEISATDEELAVAINRQAAILADIPEIARSAMWGCSGNGGWILVRLPDYPNDDRHRKLIEQTIIVLSAKYSDDRAAVDVKTRNPSRIMCLPGTLKCKGSDLADRPYRLVTLEGMGWADGGEPVRFDLEGWIKVNGGSVSPPPPVPSRPAAQRGGGRDSVIERARAFIARAEPAISGQGGHDRTFSETTALILGFDLTIAEARPILQEYNLRCIPPWSDAEIEHKLESANQKDGPRGYLLAGNGDWKAEAAARYYIDPGEGDEPPSLGGNVEVPGGQEDNSHRLARAYRGDVFSHPDGSGLRYWMDEFHVWHQGRYLAVSKNEMKADIARYCEIQFRDIYNKALLQWGASGEDEKKKPKLINVTTRLVGDIHQALGGLTMLPASLFYRQPAWLSGTKIGPNGVEWRAEDMLPCRNRLVHIPSYVNRDPKYWVEPTPDFFSPYRLDFDFDESAPEPTHWLTFLGARDLSDDIGIKYQVWPDDPQSIQTLREWMGLQLLPITRYQKIGCFIGPPRSGKGTVAGVMRAMVGDQNCAGPTLNSFSTNFGLQPLIGRPTAIIDDARLGPKSDHASIAERLLSISGEGTLSIDRKHKEAWTGVLTTRITYISNELPRLLDSSTALANRLLMLRFTRSFLGKEDSRLRDKFQAEMPGILLWALQGYATLLARGRFEQPESGDGLLEEMGEASSPISQFASDCLEDCQAGMLPIPDAYRLWTLWCEDQGIKNVGTQADLGRALRTIKPNLETVGVMKHGVRFRAFRGFRAIRDTSSFSPSLPSHDSSITSADFLSPSPPF